MCYLIGFDWCGSSPLDVLCCGMPTNRQTQGPNSILTWQLWIQHLLAYISDQCNANSIISCTHYINRNDKYMYQSMNPWTLGWVSSGDEWAILRGNFFKWEYALTRYVTLSRCVYSFPCWEGDQMCTYCRYMHCVYKWRKFKKCSCKNCIYHLRYLNGLKDCRYWSCKSTIP